MMSSGVSGIHHVTAIGGEPAVNLDFYTRVLGLRLVKRTVNFDDPATWHLYFGDRLGRPGTILTFFPHERAYPGRSGSGEVTRIAFAIPPGSTDLWRRRLEAERLAVRETRSGDRAGLELEDPHGTRLALIEDGDPHGVESWTAGGVPEEAAIRGFHGVRLAVQNPDLLAVFLNRVLGLHELEPGDGSRWFETAGEGPGRWVELMGSTDPPARFGAGSVHHLAFRVPDEDAQWAMQQRLAEARVGLTEVKDRQYFRSIYFRAPGGVIFEIATDGPGFTTDEPEAALGQTLKLPSWLETHRAELERALPPLSRQEASS